MQTSPNIEALIHTLRRGKADYIPIAELGIHPLIKAQLLGHPVQTLKDDVDFWHRAGYDYIKLQPVVDFNPGKAGLSGKVLASADGTVEREWASEGEWVITSFEAFARYQFPDAAHFDYSAFEQVRALLPEGMGVIGQYGDIFTMTWNLMGLEQFSLSLFEQPGLVEAVFEKIGGLVFSMFEYFADSDAVDIIWYSDDIAYAEGLMVSPKVLRQYFFPWLQKIGALAKASGKPFIYHTDGILYDVFDDILACHVNAIHPIEPKAMDIAEVKSTVGDRLAIIGNIDVDLLSRGTPEQVRRNVLSNIEAVGQNGGYCVGSGNSIPDYVRFENYLAMIDAAKEFGRLR